MKPSNTPEYTFTFHFGRGDVMTIWARDLSHARERMKKEFPHIVYMTHPEWESLRRKRQEPVVEPEATVVADTPAEAAVEASVAV